MKGQELKNMIEILSNTQSFLNEIYEDLDAQENENESSNGVMILKSQGNIDQMASAVKRARMDINLMLQKDVPAQKKELFFRVHDGLASTQIFLEDVSSSAGKTLDLWVNSDQIYEMHRAVTAHKKFLESWLEKAPKQERKQSGMER